MNYWRAGIKHAEETSYTIVYFTTKMDDIVDVADFLKAHGLQVHCGYMRRLSAMEYFSNALTSHVATLNTFHNYDRAWLIG